MKAVAGSNAFQSSFIPIMAMLLLPMVIFVLGCRDRDQGIDYNVFETSTLHPGDSTSFKKALRLYNADSITLSLSYTMKAMEYYRQTGEEIKEINALNLAGYIYLYWNDYEASLHYFLEAHNRAKKHPKSFEFLGALHGLGRTYITMKESDKALEVLHQALKIASSTGKLREEAKIHLELGNAYTTLNQYEKALEQGQKGFSAAQKANDSISMIYTLNNIGEIYLKQGKYSKALEHLELSLKYNRVRQDAQAQAAVLGNIGEVYFSTGDFQRSVVYIQRSLEICEAQGFRIFTRDNYHSLSKAFEQSGNSGEALRYYKKYSQLGDSLYNEEKVKAIEGITNKFAQAEKDMRIADLEKQAKNRAILLWLTVVVAFLAIGVLALVFISLRLRIKLHKKEREELDDTISHKNRELVSMMMQSNQKRKMLDELEKSLNQVASSDVKNLQEFAEHMKRKIRTTQGFENEWDVLKTHFEEVHPSFFKLLQTQFPELTQYDLKLCAYIRINLTTKDIARLLNISDRSVQTAKYRMKKKMNLHPTKDLVQYIMEI